MNPLLAEFPQDQGDNLIVSKFDWEKRGIHIPYVIFITGRCGSTLLSHMVKDTGLAGVPDEFFNEGFIGAFSKDLSDKTFENYFDYVARKYSSNWRFGFQIDWYRLRNLEKLINFSNVFPSNRSTFYYMTRRDIVGQAWSYATAKATGVWHNFVDKSAQGDKPTPPALSDEAIWREIWILFEAERQMETFFSRQGIAPTRIDYEMFIADKRTVVASLLLKLGCSIETVAEATAGIGERTSKLRGEHFAQMIEFREKFSSLLIEVERLRGSEFQGLKDRLRDLYGVTI
jgi:LPS sulfotransferase NodH